MRRFRATASSILLILLLTRVFPAYALSFNDAESPRTLAQKIVDAMSDEQALAQVFMLGWVGAEPSPLIIDWIKNRNIGGVKIFGWNTGDTLKLAETVGRLQEVALATKFNIPLLVATDQEGGLVRHVKGATSETPGNMAIGASGRPADAYWSGFYIGRELALLGINMNFAPTVDLYTDRDSTLIGPRSFGEDPAAAGIFGAAFTRGQEAAGVIATAKHFPGHGDTDLDSHGVLPRINADIDTLWEREMVPYRMLSRERLPAIMSGHLAFPRTQAGETPASLSRWFLTDILRGKIGFKGLIITDDLMMNGATTFAGSLSRAAKRALEAGNDIVMLSKTPAPADPVWTYLLAAMKNEPAFAARVRDAARRTLELKLEKLRGDNFVPYVPDLAKAAAGIPDKEGTAFFLDLAARSVTVVRNEGVLPLTAADAGRVLLAGRYDDFFAAGRAAFPGAATFYAANRSASGSLITTARNYDTVIFCVEDPESLALLQAAQVGLQSGGLFSGKRVIVLSVLNPVYLDRVPWVDAAVAVYSYARESFVAGFSAFAGRIAAEGRLPFEADNE